VKYNSFCFTRPRLLLSAFALASALGLGSCSDSATSPNEERTTVTPYLVGPAHGYSADRPCFMTEKGGVHGQPWGAAGFSWPQMLFWEGNQEIASKYLEMTSAADGMDADGRAPLLGTVAWGFDMIAATGGDQATGIEDRSTWDGYRQYAEWIGARKADYLAMNSKGEVAYPGQGYISFMMPMKSEDIEPGMDSNATFGTWAGERLGKLAYKVHCRGVSAADFFVGIALGTDFHPRVLDAFARWAGKHGQSVTLPNSDVPGKWSYIQSNFQPLWYDFISSQHATFYEGVGRVLLDSGKVPMVGGQIANDPAIGRLWGNDLRIMTENLPAKYWDFMVEVQSAGDRDTPPQWRGLMSMGANASRVPDAPIGIMLDADIADFWNANSRAGHKKDWGWKYLKHLWLSSGWVHVANRDGSVRRAAQAFQRSFWDAGGTDPLQMQAILEHIPRHPFGPAIYYSVGIERSFEVPPPPNTDTPNYYYLLVKLQRDIGLSELPSNKPLVMQGINIGYWVSDLSAQNVTGANAPSAWIVYESDRLPSAERSVLSAIAPIIDPEKNPAMLDSLGPVRATGDGLNCLAFVDQNNSVMVLVTNYQGSQSKGTLQFRNVENGDFAASGLMGTPDHALHIQNNAGQFTINVPSRETYVYEIPGLKWIGH